MSCVVNISTHEAIYGNVIMIHLGFFLCVCERFFFLEIQSLISRHDYFLKHVSNVAVVLSCLSHSVSSDLNFSVLNILAQLQNFIYTKKTLVIFRFAFLYIINLTFIRVSKCFPLISKWSFLFYSTKIVLKDLFIFILHSHSPKMIH